MRVWAPRENRVKNGPGRLASPVTVFTRGLGHGCVSRRTERAGEELAPEPSANGLHGHTVLVTGGATLMGHGIVTALHAAGANTAGAETLVVQLGGRCRSSPPTSPTHRRRAGRRHGRAHGRGVRRPRRWARRRWSRSRGRWRWTWPWTGSASTRSARAGRGRRSWMSCRAATARRPTASPRPSTSPAGSPTQPRSEPWSRSC